MREETDWMRNSAEATSPIEVAPRARTTRTRRSRTEEMELCWERATGDHPAEEPESQSWRMTASADSETMDMETRMGSRKREA